ncbi:NADH dehydrogenase [ubiquinone] 1 beta subcomplex subunit 11, mitochondrial [Culicoides brevitarsis]|uniref:NADH dehydrogenase [ubiquinone] 1 beta subcomplex subunit 11, mitochondrial n=1 Tax=Culicoides brevitarsis TaxID=469753 RepID=UPI00307B9F73
MANALRFARGLSTVRNALTTSSRNVRLISTTPKKQDTLAADTAPKTVEDFANPSKTKNWVSFGFDTKDQEFDKNTMHASFFFSVTLCLVFGAFVWAYAPDPLLRDWAQREAFLELRRREAAGLEPVSPDYVDVSKIHLPSDEELGAMDIII